MENGRFITIASICRMQCEIMFLRWCLISCIMLLIPRCSREFYISQGFTQSAQSCLCRARRELCNNAKIWIHYSYQLTSNLNIQLSRAAVSPMTRTQLLKKWPKNTNYLFFIFSFCHFKFLNSKVVLSKCEWDCHRMGTTEYISWRKFRFFVHRNWIIP